MATATLTLKVDASEFERVLADFERRLAAVVEDARLNGAGGGQPRGIMSLGSSVLQQSELVVPLAVAGALTAAANPRKVTRRGLLTLGFGRRAVE